MGQRCAHAGEKLNGTLTEAVIEGESGTVSSLIVASASICAPTGVAGGGAPGRRGYLRLRPGAAQSRPHRLGADAFEQAYSLVEQGREDELVALYRERLCCIGRKITVVSPLEKYEAECVGLDGEGHLLIRTADGAETTLSTGEISIRL